MGLLDKAQQKKGQSKELKDLHISQIEKTIDNAKSLSEKARQRKQEKPQPSVIGVKEEQSYEVIEEPKSLLDKAQKRKQEKPPPSLIGVKEEQSFKIIEEPKGLLDKAQKRKQGKPQPSVIGVKEEQSYEVIEEAKGLLDKAQKRKQEKPPPFAIGITEDQSINVIEEQKGFGWKTLGSKRIVYDHNVNEYRYEVIEPQLNEEEKKTKNEISHLFKMLADVDTFDMNKEEKGKFLKETLEQIIIDNDIIFDESYEKKIFYDLLENYLEEGRIDLVLSNDRISLEETIGKILFDNDIKFFESSKDKIFYHLFRDFLGYGRIDILMHDDGIEDISCDGHKTPIFLYHRKYEAIETNIYFSGEEELNSFIVKLCQISGKQISIYSPIVDGKLPDGSRLQSTLARTVTKGSTFTIRKFKENPLTPVDLIEYKSLSLEMAAYFWMAIENGASMLFCGGTASGKTTALNALSLFIPASHKIVSIEDTREVSLPHKNWIAGTTRKGFSSSDENKTGKDIDMFDLIRAALRQRPRVIIVGEVRGREAYSLFQAMATGHTSYSTVHASTIHTLIQRLENPPISLPRALLTSLDVIVFQNAIEIGGKMVRRMTSVTEIIKLDSDTNQLIFMAPFTWISKTDDRFESTKTSKIYNKIKQQNDWTDEQVELELSNRMLVLEWMGKYDIRSYQEFGKVIADYQKYPKKVLEKVKKEMKG